MQGIITGASRGLGLALTRALSERGWQLVVDARDGHALVRAVDGLEGVVAITGDVADPGHRHHLIEAAGGSIDLLVNNASILGPTPLPLLADYPVDRVSEITGIPADFARSSSGRISETPAGATASAEIRLVIWSSRIAAC